MSGLKRIMFLGFLLLVGSVTAPGHVTAAEKARPVNLIIGSGGVGGVYFPTGGAICLHVNQQLASIESQQFHCSVEPTVGSVFNIMQLANDDHQMGIAQSDVVSSAWAGTPPFEAPVKELRSIVSLYTETITMVTRKEANIRTLSDIRGKRVNLGKPGSGTERTAKQIMGACGLEPKELAAVHDLDPVAAADALRQGKIDAFLYVVGHPNETIWNLAESTEIAFTELSGACLDDLVRANPHYVQTTVPGDLYRGSEEEVPTLGVKATLMTSTALPEDLVYHITKAVVEKLYRFRRIHPDFNSPNPKSLFEGLVAPLHLGAFRYFQEMRVLEIQNGNEDPGNVTPELVVEPGGAGKALRLGRDGPYHLAQQNVTIGKPGDRNDGVILGSTVAAAASSGGVVFWLVADDDEG